MATTARRTAEERNSDPKPGTGDPSRQGQSQPRSTLDETAAAAQESGKDMVSRAKQEAESYFHGKKDTVATTMNDVVQATRQLAQTLRDREDSTVAHYTESVADQVEELTHYVENLDPQKAIHDLEDVARRQPLLFYGGLFLAGVALSRFLRASERSDGSHRSSHEPSNLSNMGFRTTDSDRRGGVSAGTPTI